MAELQIWLVASQSHGFLPFLHMVSYDKGEVVHLECKGFSLLLDVSFRQ